MLFLLCSASLELHILQSLSDSFTCELLPPTRNPTDDEPRRNSASSCICVSKRSAGSELCQPAAGRTSGSVKTPDDCSRIPQRPITASLPGCRLPIRKLARTDGRSSQSFRHREKSWRKRRRRRQKREEDRLRVFMTEKERSLSIIIVTV